MNINKDIDKSSHPKPIPVLVEFELSELNWKIVVEDAKPGEIFTAPTKGDDNFYVSYPTYKHWKDASGRFFNLVKCFVVNEVFSTPKGETPVFYHKH